MVFDGAAVVTGTDLLDATKVVDTRSLAAAPDRSADAPASPAPATVDVPVLTHASAARHELVVVDGALANLQTLLDDIRAADPERSIFVLNQDGDEVAELTAYLEQHTGFYDAIHVLSHGGPGWILLGKQTLEISAPDQSAQLWSSVKTSLTDSGDLLLYGCNVTADATSQAAITQLAQYTASDIGASNNVTGNEGDWDLESQQGEIETQALDLSSWNGSLAVSVTSSMVSNESEKYAFFTVTGAIGQTVKLELLSTGSGAGFATLGTDLSTTIQYHASQSYPLNLTWQDYTPGSSITIVNDSSRSPVLQVRVALNSDDQYEGPETFKLQVKSTNNVLLSEATATIVDGEDQILVASPKATTISEYGQFQEYTLSYKPNAVVQLNVQDGTTSNPGNVANDLDGIEYSSNGTWQTYSTGSSISFDTNGSLNVRLKIKQDTSYEGTEDFRFTVTPISSGTASSIADSSLKIVNDADLLDRSAMANLISNGDFNKSLNAMSSNDPLINDNGLLGWEFVPAGAATYARYKSDGTAPDGASSNYVYFGNSWWSINGITTFSADAYFGANGSVRSANGTNALTFTSNAGSLYGDNAHPVTLSQNIATVVGQTYRLQFYQRSEPYGLTDGLAAIQVSGDVNGQNVSDRVYFRVYHDQTKWGRYTFEFVATSTTTNIAFLNWGHFNENTYSATDELAIDDVIVNAVALPVTSTFSVTDDPTVNNILVNEGSSFGVFTVTGKPGANLDLSVSNGSASISSDISNVQWSADGLTWSNTLSGATINSNGEIFVRFMPTNDSTLETSENFTLTATYSQVQPAGISVTSGASGSGTGTIKDDGTGQWFTGTSGTGSNTAPAGSTLNDDRTLTVDGFTINEASPYGIFKVHGAAGQYVSLALATDGTGAGHAVLAADLTNAGTSVPLQYYNGTAWVDYTPGSLVQIPAGGTMLVRTKIVNDTSYENSESFVLNAMNVDATFKTGADAAAGTASATGIIKDDGTGGLFSSSNTTGNADTAGTNGLPSILNDDRPITVNNISVNEGSPCGVFTVADTAGRTITLALANGTATGAGTDYGNGEATNLRYSLDGGSTWVNYTTPFASTLTGAGTTTGLLVRTPIVNDSIYDNAETFTLTATPAGGNAVVGTATIHDDGTGQWFDGTSGAGNNSAPSGQHLDGDMPLTVNNLIVNEGTPYAIWTVTYGAGKQVTLSLTDGTSAEVAQMGATGIANVGSDLTLFQSGKQMQYYDPTANGGTGGWVDYVAGSNIAMPENAKLLVRVKVNNDTPLEVSEVLNLNVRVPPTAGVSDIAGTSTLNIDVVTNAAVLDSSIGANLVMNGSFSSFSGSSPVSWAGNMNAWGPNNTMYGVSTITDWTASGGGTMSYAFLMPGSPPSVKWTSGGVYFGNSTGWSISGAPATWYQMFDDNGMATGNYTFTGPRDYSENGPLKISQTIQTEAGATYRIQFTQGAERYSAYTDFSEPGVAAIEIDGQRVYFRINDSGLTVYTLQFTAPTSSTNISFMSWGHIGSTYPALSAELVLDNVIVNQMSGPSVTGTLTILDAGQTSYNGLPVNMFTENNSTGIPDSSGTTGLGANGLPSILNDDRANNPVVNDVTVNEGSPYGMFTVSGLPNAVVDLSATSGSANLSADLSGLAWSNDGGSTWSTNMSGATLDANGALLVRFVPTNDTTYEASESFTLTATYSATQPAGVVVTAGGADSGTGTIKDDGTGQWFTGTGANAGTGSNSAPAGAVLNDDRVISVNSIGVNESSSHAVFTVTASAGQTVNSLALANGTATGSGTDYGSASVPADNLQYSLDGGTTWQTWTAGSSFVVPSTDAAGATVPTGSPNGSFLVRTKVTNDAVFDNGETFTLTASLSSGQTSTGTGTIFDDGTGTIFTSTGGIDTTTAKNDDRGANPVVNDVTVNEGSPFAVFTVEGKPGAQMQLDLVLATGAGKAASADLSATTPALEYFDGTQWVAYDPANKPVIPSNTGGKLFVRTAVVNDAVNEGAETFTLKATYVSGTVNTALGVTANASDTGIGTIVDNGSGTKFVANDPATPGVDESAPALGTLNGNSVWVAPTVTPASGSLVLAADAPTLGNDDRPVTVTGFTVNEASPYGIFKVTGAAGQYVTLTLADGTAAGGSTSPADGSVDHSNTLEYFDGSAWQTYVPGAYVQIPSGGTTLLVRTAIVNDASFENQQSFTLTAANTQGTGAGNSATAAGNIIDNGTGSLFAEGNTTGTPDAPGTPGAPATLNDDRMGMPAVNSVTVNEASPKMVFTVTGYPGAQMTLDLGNTSIGSDVDATLGTDTGTALEVYYNGAWVAYSPSTAVLDANGKLLVRLAVTNDSPAVFEGPETLTLTATYATSSANASLGVTQGGSATGVGTIVDDGTGSVFINTNTSGTPDTSGEGYPAVLDNDKPAFSVNDVSVNEADGTMTFTVTLTGSTTLPMTVDYASSNGTATLADGDYTATSGTRSFAPGDTTKTVTVPIGNNNIFEGAETLNLNLSNATGGATIADNLGVGTIVDTADLPTVSISDVSVLEASDPYAVVTVTLSAATAMPVTFTPSLANAGTGTAFATVGTDTQNTPSGAALEYFNGTDWVSAASGVTIPAGQTSVQLRSAIRMNDGVGEQVETYSVQTNTLTAGTGAAASTIAGVTGTVTIIDYPTMSISNVVVNEASPYALVQVSLSTPASDVINFTPSLGNGTGTAGVDTGALIQYWDGGAWQSAANGITLPVGSTGVLLRTAVVQDASNEVSEVVSISTGAATHVLNTSGVSGTITIVDQGSSAPADAKMFSANASSTTPDLTPASGAVVNPASLPAGTVVLDDDRPLTINHIEVNEASPWLIWTVGGKQGQYVSLSTASGSATVGADTVNALEYWNGSAWLAYTPGTLVKVPGNTSTADGTLLVRMAVTNDFIFEGRETLTLTARNAGSTGVIGTGAIRDDGKGDLYLNGNRTGEADPMGSPGAPAFLDDDRVKPPAPVVPDASQAVVPEPAKPAAPLSLHVQQAVADSQGLAASPDAQTASRAAQASATGASAEGRNELRRTDALIDKFERVTDPNLHVQHAVQSSRDQSYVVQLPAYGMQTGLLNESMVLRDSSARRLTYGALVAQAAPATLADQTLAAMATEQPSDHLLAGEQEEPQQVAQKSTADEQALIVKELLTKKQAAHLQAAREAQRGQLSFSKQLQLTRHAVPAGRHIL